MSLLKFLRGFNTSTTYHCHAFMFSSLLHYSLHFVVLAVIVKVNTITKKNEHPLLNLWGKLVKSLRIMLWVSSNHTLYMPLRDQHLVACLSPMRQELLNTARCNLCTSRWGGYLRPCKKERSWIS